MKKARPTRKARPRAKTLDEIFQLFGGERWDLHLTGPRTVIAHSPAGAAAPPRVHLTLCDPCRARALAARGQRFSPAGWMLLPEFCVPCGAKIAQCVRLLATGGVIVFGKENQ